MVRTQVYLTEEQERGLKRLVASSGRKQSELIRAAVEDYITEHQPKDWKRALEACFGMWADRDDVAGLHERVQEEWEERLRRVWGRS
jgi:Arc/MetJ-type ribon-helix-helix transcriptional regulator